MTLASVGSFGMMIAMGWLVIALILLFIPSRRDRAGWHAARASIALLVCVGAVAFSATNIHRDFGYSSMREMIESITQQDSTIK